MIPFATGINHKYQQIQQIIREKTVVAFYEQPSQTVLPNQLVGVVVEFFDTRLFIDKQRILFNALAKSVVLILPAKIFIQTEIKVALLGCFCDPFSFILGRAVPPAIRQIMRTKFFRSHR